MMQQPDINALLECARIISKKMGWSATADWRHSEFQTLSDKILDETNIQLSTTTLKRLFGRVKYDNLPSSSTLNTIARFIGFESWMQFKTSLTSNSVEQVNTFIPKRNSLLRKLVFACVFLTCLLIAAFGFIVVRDPHSNQMIDATKVRFTSQPLATGLPNSVVFNVDIPGNSSDDILIQQHWDSTKTVKLTKGQTQATAIYYNPGYFRAKLIVDKKVIKEHDLFIRADEWIATIDKDPIPDYLKDEELITGNGMTVSRNVIEKIKTLDKICPLIYHLVRPFPGLHSDNFSLETRLQNIYGEGLAVCKTVKIFILCTNGAYIIPFTIPGCVSDINLKLNDAYFPGKSNDLSTFGIDPSTPLDVKVETKNRVTKIWVNNQLLREERYQSDAGDVVGLRFAFYGAGKVDYVRLNNAKDQPVYENNFTSLR